MGKKLLEHEGGFKREDKSLKIDYTLIPPELLRRLAVHYTYGAIEHGKHNWKNAKKLDTFKESANRHWMQWLMDENDEDHAMSLIWNVLSYEYLKENKNE